MPTLTDHIGLKKHTTADDFLVADFTQNWNRIDQFPGAYICTSTTRPTNWATSQAGMAIFETDSGLIWHWDGSGWVRNVASGFLGSAERLSDLSTTSFSYITVASANVVIPQGNRRVAVVVECSGVASTVNITQMAIYRTQSGSTLMAEWFNKGGVGSTAANQPEPSPYTLIDRPVSGPAAYSVQFKCVVGYGGISTIKATSNTRTSISVIEI